VQGFMPGLSIGCIKHACWAVPQQFACARTGLVFRDHYLWHMQYLCRLLLLIL
jgi:hypothetical protein